MPVCSLCSGRDVETLLDCGALPVCSRYLRHPDQPETLVNMRLSLCNACGLIQNPSPPDIEQLVPGFDWISYREPEAHLNLLTDQICCLAGLEQDSMILGLSEYDKPLTERLRQKGFKHIRIADPIKDYCIHHDRRGMETIQETIAQQAVTGKKALDVQSDLVVASFILEHAHNLSGFIQSLLNMVKPTGYIVVQVPDFKPAMEMFDYSSLWEEHAFYFTKESLDRCFQLSGMEIVQSSSHIHADGVVLSAICRKSSAGRRPERFSMADPAGFDLEKKFGRAFERYKKHFNQVLKEIKKDTGPIALFGAGHQACMFINLFDLARHIEFVADDDVNKQGLLMPGSKLEIRPSTELVSRGIKICLMAVSRQIQPAVIKKNTEFISLGGQFLSITDNGFHLFDPKNNAGNEMHSTGVTSIV